MRWLSKYWAETFFVGVVSFMLIFFAWAIIADNRREEEKREFMRECIKAEREARCLELWTWR